MKQLSRKNDIRPFEDATSLEFLCQRNDCAAFAYISHNKKRPNNLVLGRTFDNHIYDMLELGINEFNSLRDILGPKKALGSIPMFIFAGSAWERLDILQRLKEYMLDVFGGRDITNISLKGIDHVISLTVSEEFDNVTVNPTGIISSTNTIPLIYWRSYFIEYKRSGTIIPKVNLVDMGPNFDFEVRRHHIPSHDLQKEAFRIPAQLKAKKVKNVSHDTFGETLGRIHMERQDFNKLELRKTKGMKDDMKEFNKQRKLNNDDDENDQLEDDDENEEDDDDDDDDEEIPVKNTTTTITSTTKSTKNNTSAKVGDKRGRGK